MARSYQSERLADFTTVMSVLRREAESGWIIGEGQGLKRVLIGQDGVCERLRGVLLLYPRGIYEMRCNS